VPCIFPSPNLPPIGGSYLADLRDVHARFASGQILLSDVIHEGFLSSFPPPPLLGTTTHSFGSTVNMNVSVDGGTTFNPFSAPAAVTVKVDSTSDVGSSRFFDTEMLQLDISGGTLPAGVMIRESPTLASLGATTIEDLGGGNFAISSFFDVFVELTVDGGQTWMPQENGPTHVVLHCPDTGATFSLFLISALALVWRARAIGQPDEDARAI